MTPQRWRKISELAESVCELSPAARDALLSEACAHDEDLRSEVESILASSEQAPAYLDAPAVESYPELLESQQPRSLVGRRIGVYELVKLIASGGMGNLYLGARADRQYENNVAIKVLKRRLATKETLHRFRIERQTLATLDHPNIVRLLDGGVTEDGLPYLVMEYVEGTPLDRYCDEHRLSISKRLRVFRSVCSAVQYAHQNLIVHRDLKPNNILLLRRVRRSCSTSASSRCWIRNEVPKRSCPPQPPNGS